MVDGGAGEAKIKGDGSEEDEMGNQWLVELGGGGG